MLSTGYTQLTWNARFTVGTSENLINVIAYYEQPNVEYILNWPGL